LDTFSFEWDAWKNKENIKKHKISFDLAQRAFLDPKRIIMEDEDHSNIEKRYFCFGKIEGNVVTIRFTYRDNKIRLFDAGYWRKGRRLYEEEN